MRMGRSPPECLAGRTSKPSASSRPFCERPPLAPSQLSGTPWATSSTASRHRNAPTTSPTPDMFHSIGIGSRGEDLYHALSTREFLDLCELELFKEEANWSNQDPRRRKEILANIFA